jgi:hypothetical protein
VFVVLAEGEGRGGKRKLGNWETGKLGCEAGETGKLGNQPQPPEPNFLISQFPSATLGTLEGPWDLRVVRSFEFRDYELHIEEPADSPIRQAPLGPWADLGLADFSGSLEYRKTFDLIADFRFAISDLERPNAPRSIIFRKALVLFARSGILSFLNERE